MIPFSPLMIIACIDVFFWRAHEQDIEFFPSILLLANLMSPPFCSLQM